MPEKGERDRGVPRTVMAPPYDAISRRKLKELESDLTLMLLSPPPSVDEDEAATKAEGPVPNVIKTSLHGEIVRRFDFLRNLMSLEEESLRGDKPAHFDHMKNRLAFLEDAYRQWLLCGTSPLTQTPLDIPPQCACTSSCFAGGGEDEWMDLLYDDAPPAEVETPVESTVVHPNMEGDRIIPSEENRPPAACSQKAWSLRVAVKLLLLAAGSLVLASTWAWVRKDEQRIVFVPT